MQVVAKVLLVVALGLLAAQSASAQSASGWVSGTIKYRELNANYCDAANGQNCSDTMFTSSHAGTDRPLRQLVVTVRNQSGTILGSGTTSASGAFLMQWSASSMPSTLRLAIRLRQSSGLFEVLNTSGSPHVMYASSSKDLTPISGTTSANPQSFGNVTWTNSTLANVYAAALWTRESLSDYAVFELSFTGVEIWAFFARGVAGPIGVCNTSCALLVGTTPTIQLDDETKLANQARIHHEMGHLASQWILQRRQATDYCYPDTRGAGGCSDTDGDGVVQDPWWTLVAGEWMNSAFEEGLATFIGDRTIYRQAAPEPTTCLDTNGPCSATSADTQVERSTGNGYVNACKNSDPVGTKNPRFLRRSALVVDRYLRDVYDTTNESASCPSGDASCQAGSSHNDTVSRTFAEVLGVIKRFPDGVDDHESEEPFDAAGNIDNRDGFGGGDYVYTLRYEGAPLVNTTTARNYNCVLY